MKEFVEYLLVYLFMDGLFQVLLATVIAITILPLAARVMRCDYVRLLYHFVLFNAFLLAWGGLGNEWWRRLTARHFVVLDDAPVWAPYLPPTPFMFDHAGGGRGNWQLLGHTTFPQLYSLWAATAGPVWLLAALSLALFVRWRGRPPSAGSPMAGA